MLMTSRKAPQDPRDLHQRRADSHTRRGRLGPPPICSDAMPCTSMRRCSETRRAYDTAASPQRRCGDEAVSPSCQRPLSSSSASASSSHLPQGSRVALEHVAALGVRS